MEYLITMTTHVPDGTAEDTVEGIRTREAGRSRELAAQGHLLRLWLRWNQANGARLDFSLPMTATSSRKSWPRCP
jgi:muconolactone delta-isomerase